MTLQQQWDIWLAASFAKYPYSKIRVCMSFFEKKMGLETNSLMKSGIKRIPKENGSSSFCQVSRFICGYIPNAANFMFDADKNVIQKAALLAKCGDSSESPVDSEKVKEESKEKTKDRAKLKRANDEYKLGKIQREAYAKRNWNACK